MVLNGVDNMGHYKDCGGGGRNEKGKPSEIRSVTKHFDVIWVF